ncbi:hypothetical protein U1Q18_030869 [Sarracenia purpurea var. burkii]
MQVFMERFMGGAEKYDQAYRSTPQAQGARPQGIPSQTPVASASAAPVASVPLATQPATQATTAKALIPPTQKSQLSAAQA